MKWSEFRDRFLIVHKCGGCRSILPYEQFHDAFCPECGLRWSVAKTEGCAVCGSSALECTCMPKGLSATGTLCLRKLFFYTPRKARQPQNRILYYLKKHPNRRMARFVAKELTQALEAELSSLGVSDRAAEAGLVAVPRGRKGRAVYGFDQSVLLCRELSALSGIGQGFPLKRSFGGKEQKKMSRDRRFRNIRHLFTLSDPSAVQGKVVFLLDDVVTTGASMAACAQLLKKAGARAVIGLCMAQAL